MKIDEVYTTQEILSKGLMERVISTNSAKVFSNEQMVYFFEPIDKKLFRLASVISKQSFFP